MTITPAPRGCVTRLELFGAIVSSAFLSFHTVPANMSAHSNATLVNRLRQKAAQLSDSLNERWADTSTTELQHRAKVVGQHVLATAAGTGVAVASGVAAARTVVPGLAALSRDVGASAELIESVPLVGGLLKNTIFRGGILGGISTAACFLGVVNTLMLSDSKWDTASNWALAHAAIGLALAPLALPGVAASIPVLGATGISALLVSHAVTSRMMSGQSNWQGAIVGVFAAIALGPIGAQVAAGHDNNIILGAVSILGTLAASWMGAYIFSQGWPNLKGSETTMLNTHRVYPDKAREMELPGVRHPEIVGLGQALRNEIISCSAKINSRQKIGLRKILFSGPAGTGKTAMATGIASYLRLDFYAPPVSWLMTQPSPQAAVTQLFREARLKAASSGRPVVLFFDEAEMVFGSRDQLLAGTPADKIRHELVNAFNDELDGVDRHPGMNLIVIAATNHTDLFDASILSRFLVHEKRNPPTADDTAKIITTGCARATKRCRPTVQSAFQFDPQTVNNWAQHLYQAECSGRDIARIIDQASNAVSAQCHLNKQTTVEEAKLLAQNSFEGLIAETIADKRERNQRTRGNVTHTQAVL
jgi:hypothetical protein